MCSPASMSTPLEALVLADGDHALAAEVLANAEFHSARSVIASGKLSRELEERKEAIRREIARQQDELDLIIQKQDQLRQRKAEKERAVAIAQDLEAEVVEINEGKQEADVVPGDDDVPMPDGDGSLAEEALAIVQQHWYTGSSYYYPFWFNDTEPTREVARALKYRTIWVKARPSGIIDQASYYTLQKIERNGTIKFLPRGGKRSLKAGLTFEYGIPVTKRTAKMPPLVPRHLVEQYKRAKATEEACFRAIMEIIPGIGGYAKKGKGRILGPGAFQITTVNGTKWWLGIKKDAQNHPALVYGMRGYLLKSNPQPVDDTLLRATTSENVRKLIAAYEKFYNSSLSLAGTSRRLAPHIAVTRDLELDDTVYIGRAKAENDIARAQAEIKERRERDAQEALLAWIQREGIAPGDLLMTQVYHSSRAGGGETYPDFFRVTPFDGNATDGKGGLYVRAYKSRGVKTTGRPLPSDLFDDITTITVDGDISRVPPGMSEFKVDSWMGD